MTTLYIFHRDLRIIDNKGLMAAAALGEPILPLFVFTPPQVSESNKLRSLNSIQFMIASLKELAEDIHADGGTLYFGYGDTEDIAATLHAKIGIKTIVEVTDYTPFAKARTAALQTFCSDAGIEYKSVHDIYIQPPGAVLTGTGKTFQKFTPFYEKARLMKVDAPAHGVPKITWRRMRSGGGRSASRISRLFSGQTTLEAISRKFIDSPNSELAVKGGRSEALELLKHLPRNYAAIHDVPAERTSMLSAHNHFGTVSIREVYTRGVALGLTEFVRQLYWRDFYGHIMNSFEDLYDISPYKFQASAPHQSEKAERAFRDWCRGTTGVPLVDAGMRELLTTGYMHNRVRLAVASWLVKDMGVHWRLGERFFAKHLVDYDATQNMMNWIWVASVLPFASAPFRKVDAYRTAEKFDPDNKYINKWLPAKATE